MDFSPKAGRKKTVFFAAALFFVSVFIFPQQKESLAAGILPEANANTIQGYGLAGGLIADYGLTNRIALGVKADYGTDFYQVSSFEALGFSRYYFQNNALPFSFFVQAGAGLIILFEGDRLVYSVLGDGALGFRFPLKKFYTEQYARFGWPHGFGFGIVVGYRFGLKSPPPEVPAVRPEPLVELTAEPALEVPENMEIIFPPNISTFMNDELTLLPAFESNMDSLYIIAGFLMEHPEYTVHLTGYANPVLKTEVEERERLMPLSISRAEFVKEQLKNLGIDGNRITVSGLGGREADQEDSQRNRRVEFRFEKR
jgi:outer membrane protein OmpA-like peptidoglycan-associated protein